MATFIPADLHRQRGFSLLELLVTLGLFMIVSWTTLSNMKALTSPLQDASAQLVSYLKQVRARALSTTFAYTLYPISTTQVGARYGVNCASTTTSSDASLTLKLPAGARLAETDWTVCFTTRGLTDQNVTLQLTDGSSQERDIEVLLGGSVRTLPWT